MSFPPEPFASPEALRSSFRHGLERMLEAHEDLGVYILVLANAAYEGELWHPLRDALQARHHLLAERIVAALRQGKRPRGPEDDLLVFLQLMALGFEHVALSDTRAADVWEVQYNPVRALRPPRASTRAIHGVRAPFDAAGFHFNKPFLDREIFWSGELHGQSVDLLYNKFPFASLHGLLVPERAAGLPQFLTPAWHGFAWDAMRTLGETLPGLAMAYNSYGAHASVNHLHFQMFLRSEPLPAEHPRFRQNGGDAPYPAVCQTFTDPTDAWLGIDELHSRSCPYNLVYRPGRVLLLARRSQGDYPPPAWSGGLAWYEMAGGASVYSREDYENLQGADLAQALEATRPA